MLESAAVEDTVDDASRPRRARSTGRSSSIAPRWTASSRGRALAEAPARRGRGEAHLGVAISEGPGHPSRHGLEDFYDVEDCTSCRGSGARHRARASGAGEAAAIDRRLARRARPAFQGRLRVYSAPSPTSSIETGARGAATVSDFGLRVGDSHDADGGMEKRFLDFVTICHAATRRTIFPPPAHRHRDLNTRA